jgi:two-component system sensor histidine kinase UhpB
MSVRARLVAAIFVALLLSFAAGAGLAAWQAVRAVRTELAAALVIGRESVAASLADAQPTPAEMRRIVHSFDGSRHLRMELLNAGTIADSSLPARDGVPPHWFLALTAPHLAPVLITAGPPAAGTLRLSTTPANEVFERWSAVRDSVILLALFSLAAAFLCSASVTQALRPLTGLSAGLKRLGRGEADVRLLETGPPEIAVLAQAFNQLSEALRTAQAQNVRLQTQILTLAEEERAEIARDLHDEVGPHLFAITTFAATIGRRLPDDETDARSQLQAIQGSTAAVQRVVREMLGRLHESAATPASLETSLLALLNFWRGVRPDIAFAFHCNLDEAILTEPMHTMFFRIAQESVSNAVRHGRPSQVSLTLAVAGSDPYLEITNDGAGGLEGSGFGLLGMRKRAADLGGTIEITQTPGWTVTAKLPAAILPPSRARVAVS